MSNNVGDLPVRAYVEPIRSVLFVDDQFPTYAEPDVGAEQERARILWSACRDRGWLCDIDNTIEWTTEEQQKRLASSDLIVLDYQLSGTDPTPALEMIAQLASVATPNLVVVYTAASDLDNVLLRLATFARGVCQALLDKDLPDEIADLEGQMEWSTEALRAFIGGARGWRTEFAKEHREVNKKADLDNLRSLVERTLNNDFRAPPVDEIRRIEAIGLENGNRWFQCGNLFVAVVGKPGPYSVDDEASTLFNGLEEAVRAWNPSWLACLVATSRHQSNEGAFRDDLVLTNEHLRNGLVQYVASAADDEEKLRRSRYVASDLLRRRFDEATAAMGEQLLKQVPASVALNANAYQSALLHLNAFLCAQRHDRHHLRVGTVFRIEGEEHYWVCVTPACDMVPRPRSVGVDPWGHSLAETRVMTAIRLDKAGTATKALENAEHGRYIFFQDFSGGAQDPIAAAVFQPTGAPNPKIEHMFASDLARVKEGRATVRRVAPSENGIKLADEQSCIVVCQLRAPYAERLTHIVGGHTSRIGVDFLAYKRAEVTDSEAP